MAKLLFHAKEDVISSLQSVVDLVNLYPPDVLKLEVDWFESINEAFNFLAEARKKQLETARTN